MNTSLPTISAISVRRNTGNNWFIQPSNIECNHNMQNIANFDELINMAKLAKDREIADLKDNNKDLKVIIKNQKKAIEDLTKANDELNGKLENASTDYEKINAEKEEAVNNYYECVRILNDKVKVLNNTERKNETQKVDIDKLNEALKVRDHKIRQFEIQIEKMMTERQAIVDGYESYKQQLNEEKADNNKLKREIKVIDDDLKYTLRKKDELERKVNELKRDINRDQRSVNESNESKRKCEQLNKDIDVLNKKFENKCQELIKMDNEKTGLEIEINQLEAQCVQLKKNLVKMRTVSDKAIDSLKRSRNYYYQANERSKRRVLAEKIYSRNQAKLIKRMPEVQHEKVQQIHKQAFKKLLKKVDKLKKDITESEKEVETKTTNVQKRVIKAADESNESARKVAKITATKLPDNNTMCGFCGKQFPDTGNLQKHYTMVHMQTGLANNMDDRVDRGNTECRNNNIEVMTLDDTDDENEDNAERVGVDGVDSD